MENPHFKKSLGNDSSEEDFIRFISNNNPDTTPEEIEQIDYLVKRIAQNMFLFEGKAHIETAKSDYVNLLGILYKSGIIFKKNKQAQVVKPFNKWAVVCLKEGKEYISAIFDEFNSAREWAKDNATAVYRLNPISAKEYPIFILQSGRDLFFLESKEIANQKIKELKLKKYVIFTIKESFWFDNGEDKMGSLDHEHFGE